MTHLYSLLSNSTRADSQSIMISIIMSSYLVADLGGGRGYAELGAAENLQKPRPPPPNFFFI